MHHACMSNDPVKRRPVKLQLSNDRLVIGSVSAAVSAAISAAVSAAGEAETCVKGSSTVLSYNLGSTA